MIQLHFAPVLKSNGIQKAGQRGPLYCVSHMGSIIVDATPEPFLAGCRALLAMGVTGPVEGCDSIRQFPRMTGTVEQAAGLAVEEGNRRPRFVQFKPFNGGNAIQGNRPANGTEPSLADDIAAGDDTAVAGEPSITPQQLSLF